MNAFSASLVGDEPDMGVAAAAPKQTTPPTAKKPSPVTHRRRQEPKEPVHAPPPAAAKPKKQPDTSQDIFSDDFFSDVSNTTLDMSTSSKTSARKEERPFSIEGDSDLFVPISSANKKAPRRTVDANEDIFAKPPPVSLDASMDDIFATPAMLGQSSKQSSVETDPTYEDIFAQGSDTKSKRSTLTDLAIDEDLFGDSTVSKITGKRL